MRLLDFILTVNNTPPEITTTDIMIADEDVIYSVDYNSTDDGQGNIEWSLDTNASSWLNINQNTGILSGTPTNDEVGTYYVTVNVSDGNGGFDEAKFDLIVSNINDPPHIQEKPIDISMDEDTIDRSPTCT